MPVSEETLAKTLSKSDQTRGLYHCRRVPRPAVEFQSVLIDDEHVIRQPPTPGGRAFPALLLLSVHPLPGKRRRVRDARSFQLRRVVHAEHARYRAVVAVAVVVARHQPRRPT